MFERPKLSLVHDKAAALAWASTLDWKGCDRLRLDDAALFLNATKEQVLCAVARGQLAPCHGSRWKPSFLQSSLFEFLRDDARVLPSAGDAAEFVCAARDAEEELRTLPPRVQYARVDRSRPMHLYLLEIVGHCVKVGITSNPKARLASHVSAARRHGREAGRAWVSVVDSRVADFEAEIQGASPTEYLERDFDEVLAQALALMSGARETRHVD